MFIFYIKALSKLSHGDKRIPLMAWKSIKSGSIPIPDNYLNADAEILHNTTKHQYKNRIKVEAQTV